MACGAASWCLNTLQPSHHPRQRHAQALSQFFHLAHLIINFLSERLERMHMDPQGGASLHCHLYLSASAQSVNSLTVQACQLVVSFI
jgi:hypothetical protein